MDKKKRTYKILTVFFMLLIVVFLAFTYLPSSTGTYNSTMEQWEWYLTTGWNDVTFTQMQINACDSDDVEDVFVSIIDYVDAVFYEDENGDWSSWIPDRGFNALANIVPGTYQVSVSQDCILTIGTETLPPDITVTSNLAVTSIGVIGVIGFLASGTRYLMLVKH